MPKKKGGKTAAALCVGADRLEMKVCQLRQGKVEPIDRLDYPIELGREIRSSGRLSLETVRELADVLQGFGGVLTEYGTEMCRAVYSSPIQSAENCGYVFGQLRARSGIDVVSLRNGEEEALLSWGMLRSLLESYSFFREQDGLLVLMGENATTLVEINHGQMSMCQRLSMTLFRLSRLRVLAEEAVEDFGDVVTEQIQSMIPKTSTRTYSYLASHGTEAIMVLRMAGGVEGPKGIWHASSDQIHQLAEDWASRPLEQLAEKFDLPQQMLSRVYTVMMVLDSLLQQKEIPQVLATEGSLLDRILELSLLPKGRASFNTHLEQGALEEGRELSRRFFCEQQHTEQVRVFSAKLFDRTKRLHGLNGRWRLYLQIAALLHDCGAYVGERSYAAAREILNHLPLYGLSREELPLVSGILNLKDTHLPVARMRALFLLADALDMGRRQKLSDLTVKIDGERLLVIAVSNENVYLERVAFEEAAVLFESVYGLRPVLQIRSTLL